MATQAVQPFDPYSAIAEIAPQFSRTQVEIAKRTVAKDLTDDEFLIFMAVAARTGLDVFTKQIYAIKRNERQPDGSYKPRMTIQTGIDGYNAIATDTGELAGVDPIEYDTEDAAQPKWAKATIYRRTRDGFIAKFSYVARFSEYVQLDRNGKPMGMWPKMPYSQLGKCALSRVFRLGFPTQLSGIYTREEMEQADSQYTPMVDADTTTRESLRRLPEVTPIRAVESKPAPSAESSEQLVTIAMCYDYAKRQHVTAQAWNEIKRRCSNNPQLIWDALHTSEAEDIEDEDAALATLAFSDSEPDTTDDDAQDALTSFAEAFTDATPEQDTPIADAAWNDLQRRMTALLLPVSEQESLIYTITGKGGMSDLDARDWHKVDAEVTRREMETAQQHEYDLRKVTPGGKGRRH